MLLRSSERVTDGKKCVLGVLTPEQPKRRPTDALKLKENIMLNALMKFVIEDILSIDRDDLIIFALIASIFVQVVVYFLFIDQVATLPFEGY